MENLDQDKQADNTTWNYAMNFPSTPPRKKPRDQPEPVTPLKASKGSGSKRKTATPFPQVTSMDGGTKHMEVDEKESKHMSEGHWWYAYHDNAPQNVHWKTSETDKAWTRPYDQYWETAEHIEDGDQRTRQRSSRSTIPGRKATLG